MYVLMTNRVCKKILYLQPIGFRACKDIQQNAFAICSIVLKRRKFQLSRLAKEQVVSVRDVHGRDLLANGHPTAQHEQEALVFFMYILN